MALYAVHSASGAPADLRGSVFVKQGFRFWAFAFAPLWLLAQRLWLAFAGWLVAAMAIGALVNAHALAPGAGGALNLLLSAFIGFEGAGMVGARLARAGKPEIALSGGRRLEDAERAFFSRAPEAPPAAAPPPAAYPPSRPSAGGVIGMFPEAGR